MLRLLTLNYEFPPIGGGGGNAHKYLLSELSEFYDIDITLLSVTDRAEPYSERLHRNVQGHFLPLPKQQKMFWRRSEIVRYLLTHYGFLNRYLRDVPFDLCHVFFGFPTGLLAYLFKKKVPYLVSVRGSDVPGYNQRFSADYVLLRPWLKRIYHSSRAVVANSSGLQHLFEHQFPSIPARVIPNGVDTRLFYPMETKINTDFQIVSVARLIPRKGLDRLLAACQIVHDHGFSFQCHLFGEGPEEPRLTTLANQLHLGERIHFHGGVDKAKLAEFLPQCDLFVLPSYAEGMSNAALEAMACGLPLLLTETGGSLELINGNGMVVPAGDATALADRIMRLMANPERLEEMGKQSRTLAEEMSWKNVAQSYYDLYQELAGR